MTQKDILLEQMKACHNEKSWFVPIKDALAGLTAKQAGRNDGKTNNSIWQIVNHLIFWNQRYLTRFKEKTPPALEGGNIATFEIENNSEENWKITVEKIENVMAEFQSRVAKSDGSKFEGPAFEGAADSWYLYLAHITIHNAYHIGQIVTLRKQHGNWNPEQGVNS